MAEIRFCWYGPLNGDPLLIFNSRPQWWLEAHEVPSTRYVKSVDPLDRSHGQVCAWFYWPDYVSFERHRVVVEDSNEPQEWSYHPSLPITHWRMLTEQPCLQAAGNPEWALEYLPEPDLMTMLIAGLVLLVLLGRQRCR